MPIRQTSQAPFRMTARRWIILLAIFTIVLAQTGPFAGIGLDVLADTAMDRTGTISVSAANIRSGPGTTYGIVSKLYTGHAVHVTGVTTGEAVSGYGDQWYSISFSQNDQTLSGYVVAGFVTLDPPVVNYTPDEAFEASMTSEGFPESYKPGLRALHAQYPNWTFRSLQTGLEWSTVIANENYPGRSLISTSNDGYKSTEEAAYDWTTNTWTVYDGSTWVMCNTAVIAYYMDPRNFFNETRVFQFEALNYTAGVQTLEGVEKVLSGSFMGGTGFTYIDAATGTEMSTTYAAAFMKAAELANVSPYHLASRSRTEVGSNGSSSVSGTFSADKVAKYAAQGITYTPDATDLACDGIYNFYNIGASSSTELLGNVKNGLNYALKSTILFTMPEFNPSYDASIPADQQVVTAIPWNNRLRSIVAGSMFIGSRYINVGQNTLYLQKFDVDNSDNKLYYHQYMGNIIAPWAEAQKIYNAYSGTGILSDPMTFVIPVYLNMPEAACQLPNAGNPNNWLSSLAVDGYSLTPTFDPASTGEYSLIVENGVTSVNVAATPVTAKSSVSGAGTIQLAEGYNTLNLAVTAENGSVRTYVLTIVRKDAAGNIPSPTPAPTAAPTAAPTPAPTTVPDRTVDNTAVSSSTVVVGETTICGINPQDGQNTAAALAASLTPPAGCTVAVVNADGSACTGLAGTGCRVQVLSGAAVVREYTVVLFGDANGDGKINAIDLSAINWHLLKKKIVSDSYLAAADVNHDGKVNAVDLATSVRHILKTLTIVQS